MKKIKTNGFGKLVLATGMFISTVTAAAPITFDVNAADKAAVLANYSIFSGGDVWQAAVSNGALTLTSGSGASTFLNFGAFSGDVSISFTAAITQDSPFGAGNIGIRIGDNNLVYHPGYGGGAFRIEGPGGHHNQNMGFTPDAYTGGRVTANINATTGQVLFTYVDGVNNSNVFSEVFNHTNYIAGTTVIGLTVGGSVKGVFDNLSVQSVTAVPEPESYALFMSGLAIVGAIARRRKPSAQADNADTSPAA